jgi:alkanesulfonate monooxygenase SsuD/methylene tetrahydromethanopterin reductase-like flavin-dependent oxidoreductase (luciferase family)
MAGQFGWIPMSINLAPPVQIKTHWDSIEEGALEAGTQPDRSLWRVAREVFIADTTSEARRMMQEGTLARDFERYFLPMLAYDGRLGIFKIDPDMPDSDVTIDYLMDNVFIVGSADEVTQKLNDLNGELGGFGTLLAMGHEWDPYDAWYESMSVLVKEVLPKVD